jgi:hypothetical protein
MKMLLFVMVLVMGAGLAQGGRGEAMTPGGLPVPIFGGAPWQMMPDAECRPVWEATRERFRLVGFADRRAVACLVVSKDRLRGRTMAEFLEEGWRNAQPLFQTAHSLRRALINVGMQFENVRIYVFGGVHELGGLRPRIEHLIFVEREADIVLIEPR